MLLKGSKLIEGRVDKENVLQAVVILDSFNDDFAPFTTNFPKCLLTLANRPLLSYTFELLSSAGVGEVILFCTKFADTIKNFVKSRKWPGLIVTFVVSERCMSVGDAMRDLDGKALIRSDFVLFTGDIVGNVNLLSIVDKHRQNVTNDKSVVMTMVYKECGMRLKGPEDDFVALIDESTGRLLLHNNLNSSKIDIPLEMCLDHSDVQLRSDLIDTHIYVCSIAVPPLFSDNFDFQTMNDFLSGLLVNQEILTSTISSYVLQRNQYASNPSSWFKYQSITYDVIQRWTFPQVPDSDMVDQYIFHRNNIYTQKNITLSQRCSLKKDIIIGSGTVVGSKSCIISCVIGQNCRIGNNVLLEGAFLMDNVIIEDSCTISYSVIGAESIVKVGAKVINGSILGQGVTVEDGMEIIGLKLEASSDNDQNKVCSNAYVFQSSFDDETLSESDGGVQTSKGLRFNFDTDLHTDWEDSSESGEDDARNMSPLLDDLNLFYSEVVDSLLRGYEDKVLCDNLILEINSSRHAYNVSVREMSFNIVKALLTLVKDSENETENTEKMVAGKYWQQLASRIHYFLPILKNYINTVDSQTECLSAIEEVAEHHRYLITVCPKLIHFFYDKDILFEDCILKWYNSLSEDSQVTEKLRLQMKPFIQWLEESEVESDDE